MSTGALDAITAEEESHGETYSVFLSRLTKLQYTMLCSGAPSARR